MSRPLTLQTMSPEELEKIELKILEEFKNHGKRFFKTSEIAKLFNLRIETVDYWCREKKLNCMSFLKYYVIDVADLILFINKYIEEAKKKSRKRNPSAF